MLTTLTFFPLVLISLELIWIQTQFTRKLQRMSSFLDVNEDCWLNE
jgi:hypothetical protein